MMGVIWPVTVLALMVVVMWLYIPQGLSQNLGLGSWLVAVSMAIRYPMLNQILKAMKHSNARHQSTCNPYSEQDGRGSSGPR